MNRLPLIAGFAPDASIGRRGARVITSGEFVTTAQGLADRLPEGDSGLLLCEDRLAFALGFAAMLLRRSTALLPPSHATHAIDRIIQSRAPAFAIVDRAGVAPAVPEFRVDPWASVAPARDVPSIAEDHVAAIVYTSGTTGDPQPHAKTWSSLARGAAGLRERVGFQVADAIVGAVPAQHMWGLEATVMLALQSGGTLHAGVPLLPHDIAAALAEFPGPGRRWLVLTPLHIRTCVQANVKLPALAGTLTATSALECDLAERFERATCAPTIEIYGSTETGVIGTRRPALESAFTPLQGLSVEALADGLLLRGAQLDGEIRLRDRAVIEPSGRFTLAGRDEDLVKVGGKRASLAMLNRSLLAIDGVVDGGFVVPEARGSMSRLAALAVAPTLDASRILAALRERVDPVFLPRPLHRVDAMPRDPLGKMPMDALRRRVAELSAARAPAPENSSTCVREFVVPATHPALPGHFPGRPIVPAAWLLTLVVAACREAWDVRMPIRLDHARFRAPLGPGDVLRVVLDRRAEGRITFACTSGTRRVADGSMTLRTGCRSREGGNPASLLEKTLGPRLRGDDADASPRGDDADASPARGRQSG